MKFLSVSKLSETVVKVQFSDDIYTKVYLDSGYMSTYINGINDVISPKSKKGRFIRVCSSVVYRFALRCNCCDLRLMDNLNEMLNDINNHLN